VSTLYDTLDSVMTAGTGSDIGIRVLVAPTPFQLPDASGSTAGAHETIRSYQRILVELWQADLLPGEIKGSPTWSAPAPIGPWAQRDPDRLLPLFIRTDESLDGQVYEIQCPGSWWGSYDALERVLRPSSDTLGERFTQDLQALYPDGARIMHLFDSSTSPHENRYFAHRVRRLCPDFRYWGLDPDAAQENCDLIRSHSYCSLVAEDLFRVRLEQLAAGDLRFDLPPIAVFDQKAPMALPFDRRYAAHFTDDHRSLFPFTSLVRGEEVELEDGEVLKIVELLRRPPESRPYVLKYAGLDTTRNWGARGVIALRGLTDEQALELVPMLARDECAGEPWILQAEIVSAGEVKFEETDGSSRSRAMNLKISHFLGPTCSLGKLLQASPGRVRWNSQSVLSLVADSS
jgi:hypothetical protein